MAGVITHIYVADLLVERGLLEITSRSNYLLGSIAPDAIMSKKIYHRDDKKISHLREGISSVDWYKSEYRSLFKERVIEFYKKEVLGKKNDFAFGYLVHLLTDQAFHYTFRVDVINSLKERKLPYDGRGLLLAMVNDLDAMDYALLETNQHLYEELIESKSICMENHIDNLIDSESLCENYDWIEDKFGNDTLSNSKFIYFQKSKMQDLFSEVIEFIHKALKDLDY